MYLIVKKPVKLIKCQRHIGIKNGSLYCCSRIDKASITASGILSIGSFQMRQLRSQTAGFQPLNWDPVGTRYISSTYDLFII